MAAVVLVGGYYVHTHRIGKTSVNSAPEVRYRCPMHPTYISDKPGDCPICGMKLVPIEEAKPGSRPAGTAGMSAERKILYWQDPMNPQHRSDKPGKAPDGMDLVPVYADENAPSEGSRVEGYTTVTIPQDRIRNMGITLTKAARMSLDQSFRTFGRVAYDETRVYHVHTRFEGYIEDLYVNYTGQFVKKDQPLFSVYSPELYATQNEYLLALKARDQRQESKWPFGSGSGVDLVAAARERLSLWDIGDNEIRELEKTRKASRDLVIASPVSGYVITKMAVHGLKVTPSDNLYDIVDLSTVWVLADVYEVNLASVKVGQPAAINLDFEPGKTWRGRVAFIDPTVDPVTRTVKARLEFANPYGELKPEMYAHVVIGGLTATGVAVPDNAVISTGERNIVFVAKGNGVFAPREVVLGAHVRNLYEIRQGISEGEQVVTGANFLLDSESKLKAATSVGTGEQKHGS